MDNTLPQPLHNALAHPDPETVFTTLLPALCNVLQCDRCFLHIRNPHTRRYRNICWRQTDRLPDTSTEGWEYEQEWERDDPMFAAALRTEHSIFVEDIETASPTVVNREFERSNLKHRALVHAHLCQENLLWGILQPSVFGHPRAWDESERAIINQVTERLTPIVICYVRDS